MAASKKAAPEKIIVEGPEKLRPGAKLQTPKDVLEVLIGVIETHRDLLAECPPERRGIELKRIASEVKIYHQFIQSGAAEKGEKTRQSRRPGIVDRLLMEAFSPKKKARANGFRLEARYVDVETAKRAGRTGFVQMVAFLRNNPKSRVLIVEKTDRLYRNWRDYVTLDEIEGLEIHLVKENQVISLASRSSDKLIHGIKVLMAKHYIDILSEDTRKGMTEKANQGIWPSFAPLGYKNVDGPHGKRIIIPDESLAPMIHRLFELCATGHYSIKELGSLVRAERLTGRGDRPMPTSTVHKILRNRVYSRRFRMGWQALPRIL